MNKLAGWNVELRQLNRNVPQSLDSKLFQKGNNIVRVIKNIFLGLISVLFMISETYSGRYDNLEGILSLSKNDINHKMFEMRRKDKAEEEQWKNKIRYKDHHKYMVELAGTRYQSEYSSERDFVVSALNGNLEECVSLLDRGIDINANNNVGNAIGVAARNNHLELCKVLIRRGANIDIFNIEGETPLMLAAKFGNVEILELLIMNGASIHLTRPGVNLTFIDYLTKEVCDNNSKMINLLERYGLRKTEIEKEKPSGLITAKEINTIFVDTSPLTAPKSNKSYNDSTFSPGCTMQ